MNPPLTSHPSPLTSLVGSRWIAADAADPKNAPRLEFVTADRVSGYSGCNMMSGTWKLEGDSVRLGSLVATKRGCMGPAGEMETRVFAALSEQARGRREGAKLVFTGPAGQRFEFVEAK